ITFQSGSSSFGSIPWVVRMAAARLGLTAARLAKDIRATHGIEPKELDPDWNVITHLQEREAVYAQLQARQSDLNQKMWQKFQELAAPTRSEKQRSAPGADGAENSAQF